MSGSRPYKRYIHAGRFRLALHVHPPRRELQAAVLFGHPMMSHAGPLRPLARSLTQHGCSCWRLDFRGHGVSEGSARRDDWSFDDLVREDWPAAVEAVRHEQPDVPLFALGHSLGGLVALAAQATGTAVMDAIGLLSAGLWQRRDIGRLAGHLRRAAALATLPAVRLCRRFPARDLRLGIDESATFWRQCIHWGRQGSWTSLDGIDYLAACARITVPVHGWRGAHDPFVRLSDHARLVEAAGGAWSLVPAAGHMNLPLVAAAELGDWIDCLLESPDGP